MDRAAARPVLFWHFARIIRINDSCFIREKVSRCNEEPYLNDRAFGCECSVYIFMVIPKVSYVNCI
ncbi:hypothetical protein B33_06130 [Bacillus safensis]|nr:hypothetical protein B33_06130 [Bacillus safensis]